jgi:hypothetical protein
MNKPGAVQQIKPNQRACDAQANMLQWRPQKSKTTGGASPVVLEV